MTLLLPVALFIVFTIPYLAGYLLGSIPFGLVLARLSGLGDLRTQGSGNIGATNVLRLGGKGLAAATLLLDLAKGTAGVFAGQLLFGALMAWSPVPPFDAPPAAALFGGILGGFGAFLGHLYPVWLRFKGGKGVATFIGVLLGLNWQLAVIFCACWLVVAAVFRYSSLAALVAGAVIPPVAFATSSTNTAIAVSVMSLFVVLRHRANIRRLMNGEETKIGGDKITTQGQAN